MYANEEIFLLIDKKNDLEIIASALTTKTNFNGSTISTAEQLYKFADAAKFPSHGVIVRRAKEYTEMTKGITDWKTLSKTVTCLIEKYGVAMWKQI